MELSQTWWEKINGAELEFGVELFFFGVECSQTGLTPQLHKEVWKKILEYQEKLLKIIGAGMKIGSGAGIHGVELSQTLLVQYYTKKLWIKSTSSFAASWKIVVHEQTSPIFNDIQWYENY